MCEFVARGSPDALAYSIDDLTPRGTCRRVLDRVVPENRERHRTGATKGTEHARLTREREWVRRAIACHRQRRTDDSHPPERVMPLRDVDSEVRVRAPHFVA